MLVPVGFKKFCPMALAGGCSKTKLRIRVISTNVDLVEF